MPETHPQAVALLIAIVVCVCAFNWRTTLRIVLFVSVALAVFGAVIVFQSVVPHL